MSALTLLSADVICAVEFLRDSRGSPESGLEADVVVCGRLTCLGELTFALPPFAPSGRSTRSQLPHPSSPHLIMAPRLPRVYLIRKSTVLSSASKENELAADIYFPPRSGHGEVSSTSSRHLGPYPSLTAS